MPAKVPSVSKIQIIRHAEKPDGAGQGVMPDGSRSDDALIVRGWQRSGGLVGLFAPPSGPLRDARLARPGTILAARTSPTKGSQRPYQTVATLAEAPGLDPGRFVTFDKSDIEGVVDAALGARGAALICWQHEGIPTIAGAIADATGLPVTPAPPSPWPPPEWPGHRFDLVWVLDAVGSPPTAWTFTQVPQLLLPGDTDTLITTTGG